MPSVDCRLQPSALGDQGAIRGSLPLEQGSAAYPESGGQAIFNKRSAPRIDVEAGAVDEGGVRGSNEIGSGQSHAASTGAQQSA